MGLTYWIDIVGSCNLRCPSCPQGVLTQGPQHDSRAGFMDSVMFGEILQKIHDEEGESGTEVHLYSWGEPLLHPEVCDFIRATKAYGFRCGLSSNLNAVRDMKGLVRASPDVIRISTSGYYQETYSVTHRNGNAWQLKANMYHLARELDRQRRSTRVQVLYHVYRDNADENLEMMVVLCEELGFKLDPVWAYIMPVERCLRILEGDSSEEDEFVLGRLAVPLESALAKVRSMDWSCRMRDNEMVINHDGSVQLCCASFDRTGRVASSFLAETMDRLSEKRQTHSLCQRCVARGLNNYLAYEGSSVLDDIGNERMSSWSVYRVQQYSSPQLAPRRSER